MSYDYSETLNPKKALIWRIVHHSNIPWILDNGLYCGNSPLRCSDWVSIGNLELIDRRARHVIPIAPKGCLNDYIPFYFTPFSPMLLNIKCGRSVAQRTNEEIVILVSSLHRVDKVGLQYIFTDRHAYYQWANFYTDLEDLRHIDWTLLQRRDFKRDGDDPDKFERYQAEALVYRHCPIDALLGMICYNTQVEQQINQWLERRSIAMDVYARPGWYF